MGCTGPPPLNDRNRRLVAQAATAIEHSSPVYGRWATLSRVAQGAADIVF